MTVGENIRRIRKEKGLTQKQLGELCNMKEANIRKYELDKANPKIETIDRIASALGVSIAQIKENVTWEERKNTSEYQKLEHHVTVTEGILALLNELYGYVESKPVYGEYGEGRYYLVGKEAEQFVLYDGHIDDIHEYFKKSVPFLIAHMKDCRPESEIVQTYLEELGEPPDFLNKNT